jgi:hypothetical protein
MLKTPVAETLLREPGLSPGQTALRRSPHDDQLSSSRCNDVTFLQPPISATGESVPNLSRTQYFVHQVCYTFGHFNVILTLITQLAVTRVEVRNDTFSTEAPARLIAILLLRPFRGGSTLSGTQCDQIRSVVPT